MNRSVLVTGASGGIGSAICEVMSGEGFDVIGIDKKPSQWTRGYASALDDPELSALLKSRFQFQGLAAIVHSAAWQVFGDMHDQNPNVWKDVMHTNVFSLSNLVAAFRSELSSNRGSVVAIGSVHSISSRKGIGVYAVSKAALNGWVKSASLELAPLVRVNSVAPGAISSGAFREFIESAGEDGPSLAKEIADRTPMRRLGTPLDVAHAVAFLASEKASFITGQNLVVDGGATGLLGTEVE